MEEVCEHAWMDFWLVIAIIVEMGMETTVKPTINSFFLFSGTVYRDKI